MYKQKQLKTKEDVWDFASWIRFLGVVISLDNQHFVSTQGMSGDSGQEEAKSVCFSAELVTAVKK